MDNRGHNGSDMAKALFKFLESHNIDLKDCRGQSYDNAANMSGKYKGMQALIKDKNPLSEFVPCFGHSLNLVGRSAVNTCSAAIHCFDFVQQFFFFTASTARYATLKEKLTRADKQLYVPKRLNETRWSCRADATKAIVHGYREMREALYDIMTDEENKAVARNEACNLYEKMGKLEIAIYATFWNDILERFNATNHILQDPKMVLSAAVKALKSLKTFIETKREKYEEYEAAGIRLSGTEEYTEVRHCVRNVRLNPLDYGKAEDAQMSPKVKFRANSFLPVIDQIVQSLSDRIAAYDVACEHFGFLNRLEDMDADEISSAAASLVSFYKGDLEPSLKDELVHFVELVKLDIKDNEKIPKELYFYKILLDSGLQATFRNVEILLRIYLVLMVSSCSGERSFSKMRMIKSRLRTSVSQSRFSWLAIMSTESDILREIDFRTIITTFACQKVRKPPLFL
ncbi:52 kDa repressor of the inhibitor of the protein kinase-like [Macrobrachium rosenbergii]|uniref:52 kDa repressor of the inhibitor of the protein kinase-like n=1 Tax=Macrobrachium rosenbergii TaxID=79674 RepID=UPI0034D58D4B